MPIPDDIIPHFAGPFQFRNNGCPVVDQDSDLEIQQAAEAALRTIRGTRTGLPTFGISSQELLQGGANLEQIRAQVSEHEDRVNVDLTRTDPILRDAIDNVTVKLSTEERDNG